MVQSQSDYYPFGIMIPERSFSAGGYRFGFNGKEKDDEVKGAGNSQDYGFRIYDPRLGKFLSIDPLSRKFPFYTPYQFAGNKPIVSIDLDGLENIYYGDALDNGGSSMMVVWNNNDLDKAIDMQFRNTDPTKFDGKVNIGWDMLVLTQKMPVGKHAFTSYLTKETLKTGISPDLSKYQEIIDRITSNPEKKGLIFVFINEDEIVNADFKASTGDYKYGGIEAYYLKYEKELHGLALAFGKDEPQKDQHTKYFSTVSIPFLPQNDESPSISDIRSKYKNSQGGQGLKSNENTATNFTNSGRKFIKIEKMTPLPTGQIQLSK